MNSRLRFYLTAVMMVLLLFAFFAPSSDSIVSAQEPEERTTQHTGYMGDDVPDDVYPVDLRAGEVIEVSAEATGGGLDTYIGLRAPNGEFVIENDDRDETTLDSYFIYEVTESGRYDVVMSNFPDSSGDYLLTITVYSASAEIDLPPSAEENGERPELSGPVLHHDTPHFRIHYTLEGEDASTREFAALVGQTMEEARRIQIDELGWPAPPPDRGAGGDDRTDVYLVNLLDNAESVEYGSATPELPYGNNPNTERRERYAAPSYIILDRSYDNPDVLGDTDPIAIMRATAAHELHHVIQFGYDIADAHFWYYEATAVWMETVTFPEDQDATNMVDTVFTYPEICFGAQNDADPTGGLLMYGHWMFIQMLVDTHDDDLPMLLWDYIATHEGWDPLALALHEYDDTLLDAVRRYHLTNLVRDYDLAPLFVDDGLWIEGIIDSEGTISPLGRGIQELAANYFVVELPPGQYDMRVAEGSSSLELWLVGIKGEEGTAIPLGSGATADTSLFTDTYLMVLNADYNDDLSACEYVEYTLEIGPGTGTPAQPFMGLNARHFVPPA